MRALQRAEGWPNLEFITCSIPELSGEGAVPSTWQGVDSKWAP